MDLRLPLLTVPSLAVLVLLVLHSARTLPRVRAAGFWAAVVAYGAVRSLGVRWITEKGLGASVPYEIREPLFPLLGVPPQELAGWAIVAYLGWWLGYRLAAAMARGGEPPLFPQVAWACLFLGAISWGVEAAAVAAGWWRWTLAASNPLFLGVPFIGIVDWFFVGVDFLLPFMVITAPAFAGRPARLLTLLAFPVHFGAHLFVGRIAPSVPIPVFHLAHWALLALVACLALRSEVRDAAFDEAADRRHGWLAVTGFAVVLADLIAVDLMLGRSDLLPSVLPAVAVAAQTLRPAAGILLAAAALAAGAWLIPLALGAVPAAVHAILEWGRPHRWSPAVALALIAAAALATHGAGARDEADLTRRLERAVAARDGGELVVAEEELRAAWRDHPGSHVPPGLLGEIYYRTDRLAQAREALLDVVRIKPSHAPAFRHLAVIDLRRGDAASARRFAEAGLAAEPGDVQLQYLVSRAAGASIEPSLVRATGIGFNATRALASLAFEVGDQAGAARIVEQAVVLWPQEPWLHRTRVRLALARKDEAAARQAVLAWRQQLPGDREAAVAAASLGGDGRASGPPSPRPSP
jgi:tetratricopeptide (TPR) repeat protein